MPLNFPAQSPRPLFNICTQYTLSSYEFLAVIKAVKQQLLSRLTGLLEKVQWPPTELGHSTAATTSLSLASLTGLWQIINDNARHWLPCSIAAYCVQNNWLQAYWSEMLTDTFSVAAPCLCDDLPANVTSAPYSPFLPARRYASAVFATETYPSVCPSVCPDVRLSHAGIVPNRAKAGLWNIHHLIAPWL